MTRKLQVLCGALGAALLAGPAAAGPITVASLAYDGTISFNTASGLTIAGNLDAQYRTPTKKKAPYVFSTSLGFDNLAITPSVTVTTPPIEVIPPTPPTQIGICPGQFCIVIPGTPGLTLPSGDFDLEPTIPLGGPISVYDYSYTSQALPLGGIFNFDFGTPLFGNTLTLDNLVQTQFETGATTINESGSLGPIDGSFEYNGVLQPGGDTILGTYVLNFSGPGLLLELENFALGIINDNTDLLFDIAFNELLAANLCAGLGALQGLCNDLVGGLENVDLGITVNSLGTFSADYSKLKQIIQVPAPATLPLVALGLVLMGLVNVRRRKAVTA